MFSRQPDRWYQVESTPCDWSVLIRICFVAKKGWTISWARIVCAYEKNGASKYKKTKLPNFCEKCDTYACKTASSNIIPIVNEKGNRLYDILAMKVAFSGL